MGRARPPAGTARAAGRATPVPQYAAQIAGAATPSPPNLPAKSPEAPQRRPKMPPMAEWPNCRPESWRLARHARDCGPANLGMRQGRAAHPRGKSRRFLEPDRCQKSCRFMRHDRAHKFPPEIATIRSLSHMKFGKPRSKSMEKLQGRHSTLPWNFWGICLGL